MNANHPEVPSPGESEDRAATARFASMLGAGILGSRGLGLVRDILLAYHLGTSFVIDAWFVANRVPHFLRFHLTDGSLNAAFVPIFSEYLEKEGPAGAKRFARAGVTAFVLIMAVLTVVGVVAAPIIVRILAPGFAEVPGKLDLSAELTAWNFVYLFLIAIAALGMAMLQSMGYFRSSAASQVVFNVCIIASIFLICPRFGDEPQRWIYGIVVGTIVAGLLQLGLQILPLARRGMLPRPTTEIRHPGVGRTGRLIAPTLLSIGIGELTIVVNTMLASFIGSGAVASMEYAVRIVHMPHSICASALAVAILPYLSRQATRGDDRAFKLMFSDSLKVVIFLMTPLMLLTATMSTPVVRLLLEYGQFSSDSTSSTAYAMRWFAPFLLGASLLRVATSGFFSLQDAATPAKAAIVTLIVNLAAGLLLMGPYGIGGLAFAASVAPGAAAVVLIVILVRRLDGLPLRGWSRTLIVAGGGGGVLVAATLAVRAWVESVAGGSLAVLDKLLVVALPASAGILGYLGVALVFRPRELGLLWKATSRLRGRRSIG